MTHVNLANETTKRGTDATSASRANDLFSGVTTKVSDLVNQGATTLRGQIETVRQHGFDGVRQDVTTYARKEPVKALLLAGGIGALAALIVSRRR